MVSIPIIILTVYTTILIVVFGSVVIRIDNVEKKIERLKEAIKRAESMREDL